MAAGDDQLQVIGYLAEDGSHRLEAVFGFGKYLIQEKRVQLLLCHEFGHGNADEEAELLLRSAAQMRSPPRPTG